MRGADAFIIFLRSSGLQWKNTESNRIGILEPQLPIPTRGRDGMDKDERAVHAQRSAASTLNPALRAEFDGLTLGI